jgi:hypothetical protein
MRMVTRQRTVKRCNRVDMLKQSAQLWSYWAPLGWGENLEGEVEEVTSG